MSGIDDSKRQYQEIDLRLSELLKEILQNSVFINEAKVSINEANQSIIQANIAIIETKKLVLDLHMSMIKDAKETLIYEQYVSTIQSHLSNANLYYSIIISALIGVVGNWLVSYWFLPISESRNQGLFAFGLLFVVLLAVFWIMMISIYLKIKPPSNRKK